MSNTFFFHQHSPHSFCNKTSALSRCSSIFDSENKTGVIHSSTHQVPTAYYNSSAFSTNYSTTPGGLASPYNPGDNPFPPVSPPTYQQTSAMTGTSGYGGYQQPPPRYGSAVQNENSKFPAQETNYGYFQS